MVWKPSKGLRSYQEGWISPRVYMEKTSPPTRAGKLSRVTHANYTFIFPRNPESDFGVQIFILYPTHKQTEFVKWKVI